MNKQFPDRANISHTDKALRGLRQIGSARLITQVVTWSLTAITVHLLDPRDYGLVATAGIVTTLSQMLLDGGLAPTLISQRELPKSLQGTAMSAVLIFSLLLAAIIFTTAPLVAAFFRSPPLRLILQVQALEPPLTALGVAPTVLLSKRMQFKSLARIQLTVGISQGLLVLALAYGGARYWALIIGDLLGMSFRALLLWMSLDERPTPALSLRTLQPLIQQSGHMIAQRLSYFVISNFDIFLIGRVWGPITLGTYSVAKSLAHTAVDKIQGVTGQIAVPAFAGNTDVTDQYRNLFNVISVSAALAFPLFWTMGVVSQVALPILFGTQWLTLVLPFIAFASILPLRAIYSILNSALVGTGRTSISFRNTLTWLALLLPFILVGVTKGADGVALSWSAAFPFAFYLAMRRVAKVFAVSASTLLKPLSKPALCAAAGVLTAEGILLVCSHHLPSSIVLVLQTAVSAASYLTLLRYLSRTQYDQTLSFLRRVVSI